MTNPPNNLFIFLYPCILFSIISSNSSIFAEGTVSSSALIDEAVPQNNDSSDTAPQNDTTAGQKYTSVMEATLTEAIWFGYDKEASIATRHKIPVGKAPSIVTVITAEEIRHLGYRTFVEILRTVPGFEILKTWALGDTVPAVRGFAGDNKVRVMLNGHLVNNPLRGGAFVNFDDFPVEGIKRIEIIRGPGSAMYGENAFLG